MIDRFTSTFLRGLTIVVPIVLTVWILRWSFLTVDGALFSSNVRAKVPPGTGVVLIVLIAAAVGWLAQHKTTRRSVSAFERGMQRVPLLKLLYGTIKDFVDAFIGKRRRFDKPVMVQITDNSQFQALGFVTIEDLADFGLPGKCAVYFPQSYNFGGNLVFLPKERVTPITMDAGAALSFIMSGGVANAQEMHQPEPPPRLGATKTPATT